MKKNQLELFFSFFRFFHGFPSYLNRVRGHREPIIRAADEKLFRIRCPFVRSSDGVTLRNRG